MHRRQGLFLALQLWIALRVLYTPVGSVTKEEFYEKYKLVLSTSELEAQWARIDGSVMRARTFSAAPSEVYCVDDAVRVVKDNGSSWPGMSGGPTVDLVDPSRLLGVHIGSALSRKYNHFLSVHHPFFVHGYADVMGPYLEMIEWPSLDMKMSVVQYLSKHKEMVKNAGLWQKVESSVDGSGSMPTLCSASRKRKRKC